LQRCSISSIKIKCILAQHVDILLVPNKPQQLSIGEPSQVTDSNRKRWKYTITWQVNVIT